MMHNSKDTDNINDYIINSTSINTLLENIDEVFIRYDLNFKYIFVSSSIKKYLDIEPVDFIGKTHQEVGFPEKMAKIFDESLKKVKETKIPLDVEFNLPGKDKEYTLFTRVYPEIDHNGEVKALVTVTHDISDRIKLELELLKNIKLLEEAQELAHLGHWVWKIKENNLTWSNEIFKIFGVDKNTFNVSAEDFEKAIHPEDLTDFLKEREEMLKNENDTEIFHRLIRPNKEIRYVVERAKVIRDDQKNPIYVMGTVQDITERKLAEEKLKKTNLRLGLAQKSSKSGIWDWDMNSGKLSWSDEFYELFGMNIKEYPESFESWRKLIHPEDKELAEKNINDSIINHTPHQSIYRIIKPNSEIIWIEALGETYYESEKPIRMTGICFDITKSKEAEIELQESKEKYKSLVEEINDLIYSIDEKGVLIYVNPVVIRFSGYSKDEVMGKSFFEFIHPEDLTEVIKRFKEIPYKVHSETDLRLITKNKEIKWIRVLNKAKFIDGKFSGFTGVATDITEKKIAEKELISSLNEKEILLKELHHRVKNNMQLISSILNLESNIHHDKETIDKNRDIQNRIKSMALVHDKLYNTETFTKINLSKYLEDLIEYLSNVYKSDKEIKFNFNIAEIELAVETAIPLGLIINELVSNSLKHGFPSNLTGEITIEFIKNNKSTLIIKDNGIGINENIDINALKTLGLQLVDLLVKQLNGTIEIKSSNGTQFKIVF